MYLDHIKEKKRLNIEQDVRYSGIGLFMQYIG